MSKNYLLDDGSSLEWVDKETLRYTENGFSTLIWVDFEPGFFNGGRVIKSSSLTSWESRPEGSSSTIEVNKKQEILTKVQQYYRSQNKECRVE
ncbi:MAG: hypothetical protein WA056_05305 [Gallionella sp.]